jgi:hypothetical protein
MKIMTELVTSLEHKKIMDKQMTNSIVQDFKFVAN